MPKKIEKKLRAIAKKKGWSKEHADRYVFGTLSKIQKASKRKK